MKNLSRIRDHNLSIKIAPGVMRKCNPWSALDDICKEKTLPLRCERIRELFDAKLTHYQCLLIIASLVKYTRAAESAHERARTNAELMRTLHIQPSELRKLSNTEKLSLLHHGRVLYAREQLDMVNNLSAALDKDYGKSRRAELVMTAFAEDEKMLGKWMDVLSRI